MKTQHGTKLMTSSSVGYQRATPYVKPNVPPQVEAVLKAMIHPKHAKVKMGR